MLLNNKFPPFKFKYWLRPEQEVLEHANEYVNGLLKFDSGIKSVDFEQDFKFTWQIDSVATQLKMFGMCTLLRYLEEFPELVKKWIYLKSFMPESQAYLLCSTVESLYNGHIFSHTTSNLCALKNFTLSEFFNKCNQISKWGYNPLWSIVNSLSCFGRFVRFPISINWTPEIYKRFCDVEPIDCSEKVDFVFGKKFPGPIHAPIDISFGNI